jgi:hypothetical protein
VGARPGHRRRRPVGAGDGGVPQGARRAVAGAGEGRVRGGVVAAPHVRAPPAAPAAVLLRAPALAVPARHAAVPDAGPVRRLPRQLRAGLRHCAPPRRARPQRRLRRRHRVLEGHRRRGRGGRRRHGHGVRVAVARRGHRRECGASVAGGRRGDGRLPRRGHAHEQLQEGGRVQGQECARRRLRQLRHGGQPRPLQQWCQGLHGCQGQGKCVVYIHKRY